MGKDEVQDKITNRMPDYFQGDDKSIFFHLIFKDQLFGEI
jgi:hypothetical protein